MPKSGRLGLLLLSAVALAASVCGHALELSIESRRLFGERRANYAHPAQLFALEVAMALLVIATVAIVRRLWRCARRVGDDEDCLVPALGGIVRFGALRSAVILIGVQFAVFIGSELLEQRWAGFHGGLLSIVGPGHATAIAVHVIVGALFALALHRFSRLVCSQTRALVGAIATFAQRLSAPAIPQNPLYRHVDLWSWARKPTLLSLGLANRPPPAPFAIAA